MTIFRNHGNRLRVSGLNYSRMAFVNKKLSVVSIAGICVSFLIAGCAGIAKEQGASSLLPEIDVVQVKENSDQALKLAQDAKLSIDAINTKLTELDNKLVVLSDEVSSVSLAKIEELENRLTLLVEAYKDLQAQVKSIEILPQVKGKGPGSAATFTPSSASDILNTSAEYESYNNGLKAFNARNYELAFKLFTETLAKFPAGTYADNCQYWMGECQYATGDYAAAIGAFKKVFSYSNSSKADDAQMKIGLSFLKLGKYSDAKTELKNLIDRYPASEYIERAKKYLGEIK
jgi:tol-pal system protein YbgF